MPEDKQAKDQGGKEADDALKGDKSQDGKAGQQDADKHVSKESWDSLLTEKKKEKERADKLQAQIDKHEIEKKKAADDKLKADGKLQELVESKEKDIAAKTERIHRAELKVAAKGAGLQDMDYIDILIKSAKFNDQDELENGDELFKELQEKKPFLFTQPEPDKKPGTQNAGASWKGTGKIFTTSDLQSMTPKQREDNREEIDRQFAAGLLK